MLEKEFSERYRNAAQGQHAPAALVEETVEAAQHEQTAQAVKGEQSGQGSPTTQAAKDVRFVQVEKASRDKRAGQSKRTSQQPHVRKLRRGPRRWAMPVAACLAALAVLFGAGAAVMATSAPFAPQQARAYAKTPNLLTAELGDGVVPFALDTQTGFQGWGDGAYGSYSGLQFTVEGEGIERVQATISRGELYRVTTETHDATTEEGKAILNEAFSWKPFFAADGEYLGGYDWVSCSFVEDGYDRLDPRHQTQLRLIKRIGPTIDLPYEGEPLTFGLWFDDVERSGETGYPDYASLDGSTLTLTVAYNDGTFRTQEMTLHDGWFICDSTSTENGADFVMAEGPLVYHPKSTGDRPSHDYTYTLYGEVTAITNQPHPYSLENANQRADEAPVRGNIEDELPSYGSTATFEGIPPESRIHAVDETVTAAEWDYGVDGWTDLQWSGFEAHVSDEASAFTKPYESRELISFRGNFEYMNRCRLKTNGWSLTKEGLLNEGNSFVTVNVEVTNDRSESVKVDTEHVGALCTIDHSGNTTTFATAGVYAAKDHKARIWDRGNEIWFDPGETVRLEVVFIAANAVAEADEVYLALGAFGSMVRGELDGELDDYEYVSLGKLEKR